MWTLIIIAIVGGLSSNGGGGASVHSVPGFSSEEACKAARIDASAAVDSNSYAVRYRVMSKCVKVN